MAERGRPCLRLLHFVRNDVLDIKCHSEPWAKNLPEGWFSAEYMLLYTKSAGFAFPGVCSPVEAGEVARIAGRRGATCRGDFAGLLRMTKLSLHKCRWVNYCKIFTKPLTMILQLCYNVNIQRNCGGFIWKTNRNYR